GWLARLYRDGKAVDRDLFKAASLMDEARLGKKLWWAKDEYLNILWNLHTEDGYKTLYSVCTELSESGDTVAKGWLARLYRDGKAVDRDLFKAASLMDEARLGKKLWWAKDELDEILELLDNNVNSAHLFEFP
ncbi:MAG: hypothetical protein J5945_02350, partial [Candidatus Methanomethylophilus sp.]|nr:hypothetical protein [Methanomethylophilus sp.]